MNGPDDHKSSPSISPDPSSRGDSTLVRARRISTWTFNLLLTGVIFIAGAAVARQVSPWLSAPVTPPAEPDPLPRHWDERATLEFGSTPLSFQRQRVAGDAEQLVARMLETLVAEAAEQSVPLTPDPGPAELQLLQRLTSTNPVQSLDRVKFYLEEGPLPLACSVRELPEGPRLTGWAVALPATPEPNATPGAASPAATATSPPSDWTLFVATSRRGTSPLSPAPALPAPKAADSIMTLRDSEGSTIAVFRGPGPLSAWQEFYDRHFSQTGQWRILGDTHLAEFTQGTATVRVQLLESESVRAILTSTAPQPAKP